VEFSTYSDVYTGKVAETYEADQLFDMLDAVNVFATTGNTNDITKLLRGEGFPFENDFVSASKEFYHTLLICKTPNIESSIENLAKAINDIKNTEYSAKSPKMIVVKHLVLSVVEQKMTFIDEKYPVLAFIRWCCDNGYIQQAITFLKESVIGNNRRKYIKPSDFYVLTGLRNSINHAAGGPTYKENPPLPEVLDIVKNMLDNPEKIILFIRKILKRIEEGYIKDEKK